MPSLHWQRLFLTMILTALALPAPARAPTLRWEKMHVFHASPTVIFARLGLTHSTKNGHTRDGKQGIADPDFPPGLTDVVPNDAEHLLLARGTEGGLMLFRARVVAADIAVPLIHLKAELSRRQDTGETPAGMQEIDGVADSLPYTLSLGDGDAARVYQITTRANTDGTFWIACCISLPLPPAPAALGTEGAAGTAAVFVPDRVWTDPISRKVRPGETAEFDDLAAARQAAGRKLGMTDTDTPGDYTLRVMLTPDAADIPAPLHLR